MRRQFARVVSDRYTGGNGDGRQASARADHGGSQRGRRRPDLDRLAPALRRAAAWPQANARRRAASSRARASRTGPQSPRPAAPATAARTPPVAAADCQLMARNSANPAAATTTAAPIRTIASEVNAADLRRPLRMRLRVVATRADLLRPPVAPPRGRADQEECGRRRKALDPLRSRCAGRVRTQKHLEDQPGELGQAVPEGEQARPRSAGSARRGGSPAVRGFSPPHEASIRAPLAKLIQVIAATGR